MKKIILIVGMIFVTLNLYAAKAVTATADDNGRLYNTAFFDIKPEGTSAVYDVIGYTKRPKTFNWEKMYKVLENFKGDKIELVISTRVEIPADITTDSVYITTGETYYLNTQIDHSCCGNKKITSKENLKRTKSDNSRGYYNLSTFINDKKMEGTNSKLVKTKKDAFGNKYIDLKISFKVDLQDKGSDYIYFTPDHDVRLTFSKLFEEITVQVAPKSRTYQSKWVYPNLYVMDE